MKLTKTRILNFRSIEDSNEVEMNEGVTVLVGQNESGKTSFLQALDRTNSVDSKRKFDPIEDYPRRYLTKYQRELADKPPTVVSSIYVLSDSEIVAINGDVGNVLPINFQFSIDFKYDANKSIGLHVAEGPMVQSLCASDELKTFATELGKSTTLRQLFAKLDGLDLNEAAKSYVEGLRKKYLPGQDNWSSLLSYYIYKTFVATKLPQFVYFDDYKLLPGKVNLPSFEQRITTAASQNQQLNDQDSTIQSLLRMAGVSLAELNNPANYETIKAKLEAFSNEITDKVFKYWRQNDELDVLFDIKSDPNDQAPFNNGNNLYIRIYSRKHRVSMPFDRRSKGFIWFFSFIIWFASVKEEVKAKNDLILLLDEPGLSLHAMAQSDFLEYIEELSQEHQVVYTTHSPFMVRSEKLGQVRVVQDDKDGGTKVGSNLAGSSPKTLFPLQAALGYTIAQNLFISKRNLLVEGPSELLYMRHFSALLESANRTPLREDVTVVPTGGLDKVATFVSLLGANELEIAIVHDYDNNNAQNIADLVKLKVIEQKRIRTFEEFRPEKQAGARPTDVEDLFATEMYLDALNQTYKDKLKKPLEMASLPQGDRIVDRINRCLVANNEILRPSGGFNHYLVAQTICSAPLPSKFQKDILNVFESMFEALNKLYKK